MSTEAIAPYIDAPQRPAITNHTPRVRPRSGIADPELARAATVDLPTALSIVRPHTPAGLVRMVASLRRPLEPDRVILPLALVPVTVSSRVDRSRR